MLYRAIKYQVDKGPVDAVTGKAKRTLNDSHLLREDIEYCSVVTTATDITPVCSWVIGSFLTGRFPCLFLSDADGAGEKRS